MRSFSFCFWLLVVAIASHPKSEDIPSHPKHSSVLQPSWSGNHHALVELSPIPCASEGGSCFLSGPAVVQYGTGQGVYGAVIAERTNVPCNNGVFSDPAPGKGKTCFLLPIDYNQMGIGGFTWAVVASEGQTFTGNINCPITWARYGIGASWIYRTIFGYMPCNNAWFGFDPAPRQTKQCQVVQNQCLFVPAPSGPSRPQCAQEGQNCDLSLTQSFTKWMILTTSSSHPESRFTQSQVLLFAGSGSVPCSVNVFGDPVPFVRKFCYFLDLNKPFNSPTGSWVLAAQNPGGSVSVSLTRSLTRTNTTTTTNTFTQELSTEIEKNFVFGKAKVAAKFSFAESTQFATQVSLTTTSTCNVTCQSNVPFLYQWQWQATEQCSAANDQCALTQTSCEFSCEPQQIPPNCPFSACAASPNGCLCQDFAG
jgi:hypothetical protein